MSQSRKSLGNGRAAGAAAGLLGALALGACATLPPAPAIQADAVYEMRTYYAMPGKFEALNRRFRDHTLEIFARHGMTSVAYWAQEDAPNGRLTYVLAYPSRAARETSWAAFRADPEWQAVSKASEADGKLVEKIDSVFMRLTDYSPRLQPIPRAVTK